jgi:xanthine dehydrogenase accessory factor
MFLGPADELEDRRRDGMISVPIACQSEGALEVYLEPVFPSPHLVAAGRSPAAVALAGIAAALGWRATAVDDADLVAAGAGPGSYVVVATQGHYDEEALEQALATGASYVGLVASRTRAEAVLGYLRQRGVPEEDLARVHAPAGLDLGRIPPEEIAVAIAGEIVRLRAEGALRPAAPAPAAPALAVDPVCGMTVQIEGARHVLERDGEVFHFCCPGCLATFEAGAQHR